MDERVDKRIYRHVMQLVQTFEIFMEIFESPVIRMFDQLLWVFIIFFVIKYENQSPTEKDYEIIIDSLRFIPQNAETAFIHHIVDCILLCLDLNRNPIRCLSSEEYLHKFFYIIRSTCPRVVHELKYHMGQSELKIQLLIKRLLIEVELLSEELINFLNNIVLNK